MLVAQVQQIQLLKTTSDSSKSYIWIFQAQPRALGFRYLCIFQLRCEYSAFLCQNAVHESSQFLICIDFGILFIDTCQQLWAILENWLCFDNPRVYYYLKGGNVIFKNPTNSHPLPSLSLSEGTPETQRWGEGSNWYSSLSSRKQGWQPSPV